MSPTRQQAEHELLNCLQLSNTSLTYDFQAPGTTPSAWSKLKYVYIGLNKNRHITGTIPKVFANTANTFLDLGNTSITGCVPKGVRGFSPQCDSLTDCLCAEGCR
jgi:hypothetical protein